MDNTSIFLLVATLVAWTLIGGCLIVLTVICSKLNDIFTLLVRNKDLYVTEESSKIGLM